MHKCAVAARFVKILSKSSRAAAVGKCHVVQVAVGQFGIKSDAVVGIARAVSGNGAGSVGAMAAVAIGRRRKRRRSYLPETHHFPVRGAWIGDGAICEKAVVHVEWRIDQAHHLPFAANAVVVEWGSGAVGLYDTLHAAVVRHEPVGSIDGDIAFFLYPFYFGVSGQFGQVGRAGDADAHPTVGLFGCLVEYTQHLNAVLAQLFAEKFGIGAAVQVQVNDKPALCLAFFGDKITLAGGW